MLVLSIQGKDVRDATLREVSALLKSASRPLKMEFGALAIGSAAAANSTKPGAATKKVVFGKAGDLDLVLGSDDPLDRVWLAAEHGDGTISREEMVTVLKAMGKKNAGFVVDSVMQGMDSDRSGTVDVAEFEAWYLKQDDRKLPMSDASTPHNP